MDLTSPEQLFDVNQSLTPMHFGAVDEYNLVAAAGLYGDLPTGYPYQGSAHPSLSLRNHSADGSRRSSGSYTSLMQQPRQL